MTCCNSVPFGYLTLIVLQRPDLTLNRHRTLPASLLLTLILVTGCSTQPPAADPDPDPGSPPPADTQQPISADASQPATEDTPATSGPSESSSDSAPDAAHDSTGDSRTEIIFRTEREPFEINEQRLLAVGIHVLQSRRLILLTDRDPESVADLPSLTDAFFDYLETACGPLRPSRSAAEFQAIGCLMVDMDRFQSAGLVPGSVVTMNHGQQVGYRFWMRDQATDYYRRHLLLHEFAHVYMTCDAGLHDIADAWLMEGAAEVFATHAVVDGVPRFAILPTGFAGMEDWGRISTIRRQRIDRATNQEIATQQVPPLTRVRFPDGPLATDEARYAWWWALSWMMFRHPRYADDWTALCHSRGSQEFQKIIADVDRRHGNRLASDWLLFADSVTEGFDIARSFPLHAESDSATPATFPLTADRSWQDTGWLLEAGDQIELRVAGECVLDTTSAPWVSQPAGITLEYNQGRPLGETIAVLVNAEDGWISQRIAVGDHHIITAPRAARLWLQINDSAGDRASNSGAYDVQILRSPPESAR